jgi:hypothetical protein
MNSTGRLIFNPALTLRYILSLSIIVVVTYKQQIRVLWALLLINNRHGARAGKAS